MKDLGGVERQKIMIKIYYLSKKKKERKNEKQKEGKSHIAKDWIFKQMSFQMKINLYREIFLRKMLLIIRQRNKCYKLL